jgi:hypothetical protein
MLLKYLSIEAQVAELERKDKLPSSYDRNFIGIYLRIDAGPFKPFVNDPYRKDEMEKLFGHYFNMLVCEKIFRSLSFAVQKKVIKLNAQTMRDISRKIAGTLKAAGGQVGANASFDSCIALFKQQRKVISQYLNRSGGTRTVAYTGAFTDIRTFLYEICEILYEDVPFLQARMCRFYLLLDEYDHLYSEQQRVINTIIGIRELPLCFKIGTRIGGVKTYKDLADQQLMRPHDYERIVLDYEPHSSLYIDYIEKIANARLDAAKVPMCIRELLPGISVEDELKNILTEEELSKGYDPIKSRIQRLVEERKVEKEKHDKFFEAYYKTYKHAILFQEVSQRRPKEKDYSGFPTYVMLSSGIVRSFIELCKKAVSLALDKRIDIYAKQSIPRSIQTEAARVVAGEYYSDIRRIDLLGLQLQVLCRAFAAVFRRRLHDKRLREPETLHIEVVYPQNLSPKIRNVLDTGVVSSVIQSITPYKPRHVGLTSEAYRLNRVFAPYFGLSYRDRWRVVCPAVLLNGILDNPKRVVDELTDKSSDEIMSLARSQPSLLEYPKEKTKDTKWNERLKIERMPSEVRNRVFVGGNYDYLATLRQIKEYISDTGFEPILAFDFDVPLRDVHDFDLRLLHNCKYAVFDETYPAGELMEIERARDYGVNLLVVYQVRHASNREPPPQISGMLTTLKCAMKGYATFSELREIINDWLQEHKGA